MSEKGTEKGYRNTYRVKIILYIGDGLTDVPCMAVTMQQGGYAIAVYRPHTHRSLSTCKKLLEDRRVHFIAKAAYTENRELDIAIKKILDTMIQGVFINKEFFINSAPLAS